ncbi:MAG: ABC transporter substrate-binding protein [Candidatus Omnitrophota bacterium]|nr:ABC transporter substrate-binding protein [Candidatus Omnitrophota bacterium]MBU1929743.1 ABC transporter substrate-binding protein [Candidatus Omnitrophota bacterium]MBU2035141.1 ABC transporter substrate-binding protein [Candidatus Omnitrophota bacterium]
MLKRIAVLAILATFGLFFMTNVSAQEKIKVGIVLASDQPHYVEGMKGVLSQLKKEGFDESNVDFDIRYGDGKAEKIVEIVSDFKKRGVNLIIPIGTVAAINTYNEAKNIPIVFSLVFDPIGSGIAKAWETPGSNATGSSSWVSMISIVKLLKKISPGNRIGVIYTEREKQTVLQLEEFKKIQNKMEISVVPVELSKPEDAQAVTNALAGKVDYIFITGGTVVGEGLNAIIEVTKKLKIPTSTHLPDRAERGILLAMGADRFQLGELAGRKAAQVLRGGNPAFIPIETLEQYDITINMQTAKDMGLEIPESILKSAKEVIQPVSTPRKIKVGIILQSNQPQHQACLKGILEELKKEGFDETSVDFDIRYGSVDNNDIIIAAIKDFKEKKVDLIITTGTPTTIAASEEIKDIPVVFTQMFDPLGAKIIDRWESSGNNFTGSSNWLDLTALIKTIRKIVPGKRIGVLYSEKEMNSLSQLTQFKLLQDKLGFKLIPANLLKSEDAKALAEPLIGQVDSVYISGSNLVGENIMVILEVLNKAKIPTVAHLQGKAEQGVLLVLAVDSVQLGALAGRKAAQVLQGIKPSLIPVETLEQWDIIVNLKTAKKIGLEIPSAFLKTAKKIIE